MRTVVIAILMLGLGCRTDNNAAAINYYTTNKKHLEKNIVDETGNYAAAVIPTSLLNDRQDIRLQYEDSLVYIRMVHSGKNIGRDKSAYYYGIDNSFRIAIGADTVLPELVIPVANGMANRLEYIIGIDPYTLPTGSDTLSVYWLLPDANEKGISFQFSKRMIDQLNTNNSTRL
ncbi:hypothetical protein KJS94_12350 [Flavihumibacter rivuli]|uniref:hypothetical protein n=1 Tax=Flavihumibacter rivuli TaxID=2838156 RepID=UPI001BDEFE49|nr:hypothetical protein [Flavihumibacter rivuli]ULQ55433.1 hypothetical protein KJS94_12350 [Flavihumibacter rivuli]